MILPEETYHVFMSTLKESRADQLETGAFGLYLPKEDRIMHTLAPNELPAGSITKRSQHGVDFSTELKEEITRFNRGRSSRVNLGGAVFKRRDGMIFGYHTHPRDDHEIIPSKYDRTQLQLLQSPLEVILSGRAMQWTDKPFVIGYDEQYFPGGYDFSKIDINHLNMQKLADTLKIPVDALAELAYLKSHTGLHASITLEIMAGSLST